MGAMIFDLEIYTDEQDPENDAPAFEIRADQRDMAAFEVTYRMGTARALDEQPISFLRYLGWHALRRTGRIDNKLGFDEWALKIISVDEKEDPEKSDDDEQGLDPTSPAA